MTVELNHMIIPAKDKWASAKFLADILNLGRRDRNGAISCRSRPTTG
jgi:hypothetical protein